ncbi:hypothetical protein E2C01_010402 [Portunus trituberculatus]|uniref:Uncharacterized protein n=1 Tax=Portunus trituberculatus TaxID=210409 RepID=A0A5B7D8C3_PORTR|nr:hypothetical protein [Portunus trituberculatus]
MKPSSQNCCNHNYCNADKEGARKDTSAIFHFNVPIKIRDVRGRARPCRAPRTRDGIEDRLGRVRGGDSVTNQCITHAIAL